MEREMNEKISTTKFPFVVIDKSNKYIKCHEFNVYRYSSYKDVLVEDATVQIDYDKRIITITGNQRIEEFNCVFPGDVRKPLSPEEIDQWEDRCIIYKKKHLFSKTKVPFLRTGWNVKKKREKFEITFVGTWFLEIN